MPPFEEISGVAYGSDVMRDSKSASRTPCRDLLVSKW